MPNLKEKCIVTLTTDWGTKDYYLGAFKGRMMSLYPEAELVDITHDINAYNVSETAYILKNAYNEFPKGTLHMIGVSSSPADKYPVLIIEYDEHFFVGVDNGIFSLLFPETPSFIYAIDIPEALKTSNFLAKELFIHIATYLFQGNDFSKIGEKRTKLLPSMPFVPTFTGGAIGGQVIYIDRFENAITNITKDIWNELVKENSFSIEVGIGRQKISTVSTKFSDVPVAEVVALFGSNEHLIIAINHANAAGLLGIRVGDMVRVEVKE